MRPIDLGACMGSLALIVESPDAEKGYEDLKKYYYSNNMKSEFEAVDFLLKEKFHGHGSNTDEK